MKANIFIYLAIITFLIHFGCDYDNYNEPSSELVGQLVYEGIPIGVRSNEIELELWQSGFELSNDIPVFVDQDGTFSAILFDGEYQLVLRESNGPWIHNADSITVQLNGRFEIDLPVEPYYIINNELINYSDGSIEASFTINQINNTRNLEFAGLYIGTHTILDQINNEINTTEQGEQVIFGDTMNINLDLSDHLAAREYLFARVGIKVDGIPELLFSQIHKIEL